MKRKQENISAVAGPIGKKTSDTLNNTAHDPLREVVQTGEQQTTETTQTTRRATWIWRNAERNNRNATVNHGCAVIM